VHQQAVEDFSKVHFLSQFSDLEIDNFTKTCPSAATAPAGQEDTPPSAADTEDESQQFLLPMPLQHLPGANEPVASLRVEEIATKFRFGDAVQLCIFSKDNVVITPISPLHYWLPICRTASSKIQHWWPMQWCSSLEYQEKPDLSILGIISGAQQQMGSI
jgi:hypothetical protein